MVNQNAEVADTFRTEPLPAPPESLAPLSVVPTTGEAYFIGEMQIDVEDFNREIAPDVFYVERRYGDLILRFRFDKAFVSGEVTDIRKEDGTRHTGSLALVGAPGYLDRDGTNVFADLIFVGAGEETPEVETGAYFYVTVSGILDEDTADEAEIRGSLSGNIFNADGNIVAGQGGGVAEYGANQDWRVEELDFYVLAERGDAPATTPVNLTINRAAATQLADDLARLESDVSNLGRSATLPASGSATYNGIMTLPVPNDMILRGDLAITLDFSGQSSGSAGGFVRDDGAVLTGELRVLNDPYFNRSRNPSNPDSIDFWVEMDGTLDGAEAPYDVSAALVGQVNGGDQSGIKGDVSAVIIYDGERFSASADGDVPNPGEFAARKE